MSTGDSDKCVGSSHYESVTKTRRDSATKHAHKVVLNNADRLSREGNTIARVRPAVSTLAFEQIDP